MGDRERTGGRHDRGPQHGQHQNKLQHVSIRYRGGGRSTHCAFGTEEPSLDLETVSAVLEGGLLMVFGPDGDPLPPRAFSIAAAGQPDAGIRIGSDARAQAGRIAAVLEAQSAGRLSEGEGDAGAWIEAMLGLGPQPATCTPSELQAEDGACEITRSDDGIRISIVGGTPLLLSPARSEQPVEARYRLTRPEGGPIALADACARLWPVRNRRAPRWRRMQPGAVRSRPRAYFRLLQPAARPGPGTPCRRDNRRSPLGERGAVGTSRSGIGGQSIGLRS
jgi:hypothetical protein